jgi:hypothetical protein
VAAVKEAQPGPAPSASQKTLRSTPQLSVANEHDELARLSPQPSDWAVRLIVSVVTLRNWSGSKPIAPAVSLYGRRVSM